MSSNWYDRLVSSPDASAAALRHEVLVVDDQAEARELIAMVLRRLGWVVHLAANSEEAMAIMEVSHKTVGLALVDVVMPGQDGMSLARRLHARYPRLGIVLVSGRLNDESRWIVSEEGFRFLPKPFSLVQLKDTVVDMLGGFEPPVTR